MTEPMLEAADAILPTKPWTVAPKTYPAITEGAHKFLFDLDRWGYLHPTYGVVSTDPHTTETGTNRTSDNYHLFTAVAAHLIVLWAGVFRKDSSAMKAASWLNEHYQQYYAMCLGDRDGTIAIPHRWPKDIKSDTASHLCAHDELFGAFSMLPKVEAVRLINAAKNLHGFFNNVDPYKYEFKAFMPRILTFWPFAKYMSLGTTNILYQCMWSIQAILTSFDKEGETSGRQLVLLQIMAFRCKEAFEEKPTPMIFRLAGNLFLSRMQKTYGNHTLGPVIAKYWEKPENNFSHPVADLSWGVPIKNLYLGNLSE